MPAVELTVASQTVLRRLLARIGAASHRNRLDAELREEIDQHIELRRQQLIESGVPPAEALATARRQFGNVTRVREDTRAMWSFPTLDTVLQDLRYGARMMRRSPAVSLIAIVSLGLGIGGNRFVSSLLYEISPSSPLTLMAATGIMLGVSLLAAFIPAQRASRVDPAIALRTE